MTVAPQANSADITAMLIRELLAEGQKSAEDPVVLPRELFSDIFTRCQLNRITPLLAHAVSEAWLEIDEDQVVDLMDELTRIMTTQVAIEAMAFRSYEVLDSGGVDVRVTKGLATSHLDYPNPALRQFGDADLLVRPEHFDDALLLLADAGIRQKYPIRGGRWQVQHSVPLDADGLELDLHHRLLHQAAGHLAARTDLFAEPAVFDLGGRKLKALPAHIRLIQAAGQNVLSEDLDIKASSDVDVLLLCDVVDEAYKVANSVGLGWLLDLGVARARKAAHLHQSTARASDVLVGRVLRKTYAGPHPSPVKLAMVEAMVAPSKITAASAWGVVAPGDDYLALRGRSQEEQLRRQLSRILPRRSSIHEFKQLFRRP